VAAPLIVMIAMVLALPAGAQQEPVAPTSRLGGQQVLTPRLRGQRYQLRSLA
jgi:hypothetical protein